MTRIKAFAVLAFRKGDLTGSLSPSEARGFDRKLAKDRMMYFYMLLIIRTLWRRGRDSNHQYPYEYA